MTLPAYISVEVKDPSRNPKSYQSNYQLLETPILYDFCSQFTETESTCTPPPVSEANGCKGDIFSSDLKGASAQVIIDDNSPVYAKIPREMYDKILALAQERSSSKSTRCTWTAEEDEKLIELVNLHGPKKWSIIAASFGNAKPAKQCRERYTNHLDPEIKKGDWTLEEDSHIMQYHQTHGNQWSKIAKLIKGRTANAIKNRWHGHLKKLSPKDQNAIMVHSPVDAHAAAGLNMNTGRVTRASSSSNIYSNVRNGNVLGVGMEVNGQSVTTAHDRSTGGHRLPRPIATHDVQDMSSINGLATYAMSEFSSYGVPQNEGISSINSLTSDDTRPLVHSMGLFHSYDQPPFSSEFGASSQYLRLDSSTDTVSENDFHEASQDMHQNHLFDFPTKRKRDSDFFVVGKKMKIEIPPSNMDVSALYGEDDFAESDPLFFDESNTSDGGLKRSNIDFFTEGARGDEELYSPASSNLYNHFVDRSSNHIYDSWPSPKDCNLWSPKVTDFGHSPQHVRMGFLMYETSL